MLYFVNIIIFYISISNFYVEIICQLPEEEYFTTPDVIRDNGYIPETHEIKSKTGYKLILHRIPYEKHNSTIGPNEIIRPIVVLYHGFAQSSVHWLLIGHKNSLGKHWSKNSSFILADEGFDVWLPNLRGNTYSNKHVNLTSKSKAYWDFCFHEMGDDDFIATIDYILTLTEHKQLYIIGYNLGNTVIYTGLSLHPDYNAKVKMVISLAPIAFLTHAKTPWMIAAQNPSMSPILEMLQLTLDLTTYPISEGEITVFQTFFKGFCEKEVSNLAICTHLSYIGLGTDFEHSAANANSGKVIPTVPSLSSFKTMIHVSQIASSHRFQQYDYRTKNLKIYGSMQPPHYKIYTIKTPVSIITAANDSLSYHEDIETLANLLPNVYKRHVVPGPFAHKDFLYSFKAAELVYLECIMLIKECESMASCESNRTPK